MTDGDPAAVDRRTVLGALAGAGTASLAGCSLFEADEDAATEALADEEVRELAERFAPTLYFDEREPWFPTDPRPYERERDGETVVDGFDALDEYTRQYEESGEPPAPTVFFRGVAYEDSPLAVVQFWFYSAFDQFTTNFHWHDWEVLHAFVDVSEFRTDDGGTRPESAEPQLFVASSHSRSVPNNEFLDPERTVPRILSELGSHSSALSINDEADRFQRLSSDASFADITNSAIEGLGDLAEIPAAYGLPRDEGGRLPYVVPELDGAPLYEHDRLPHVERTDLVPEDLTVRSLDALSSPPRELPDRATGLVFEHADRDGDPDVAYDLVPASDVEHISGFNGPQLSFEFAVPSFVEDAFASHITATGAPWEQSRYDNPAADISEPNHRAALADRYDAVGAPSTVNTVVAGVTEAVASDDAPDGEGLTTRFSPVETIALLESDPEAVPTFGGVAMLRDVPAGDHRLTVNGAGVEPHSEPVSVADEGGEPTVAGADGEIPLVARENSVRLAVDADGTDADLTDLAVEDDFAGRLYDADLSGPDSVYVHRDGAYTTEVRDAEGEIGAFRVTPASEASVRVDEPDTGKGSLAAYVADVAAETRDSVAGHDTDDASGSENAVRGLANALEAVADAAERAAARAESGEGKRADASLETVVARLERVSERLAEARGDLPDDRERATDRRLDQARQRTDQARSAERL
ncbi:hypothetical protein [Natronoarchaeum mannanilyticum]|uniref:hypothetical protein n=1 Tax=Natronoarchaeum mannanilyticum TaxID=926360 RepID=UPI0031DE3790